MDILEINAKERYVRVEPMVTIGRLMEALVERGWMVPIVPEIGEDFKKKQIETCCVGHCILAYSSRRPYDRRSCDGRRNRVNLA